ncbi:hypothetical protein [Ignatzschineria indica]|nr:hypothetical protein [Ignatzschineria indica]
MKKIPNLFRYATSELSQDAMICWLLAHANPEFEDADPRLQKLALTLINQFLEKSGYPPLSEPISKDHFKIKRQYRKVDVVARVNQYLFIIEDKTVAGIHGDQLSATTATIAIRNLCSLETYGEPRGRTTCFMAIPSRGIGGATISAIAKPRRKRDGISDSYLRASRADHNADET